MGKLATSKYIYDTFSLGTSSSRFPTKSEISNLGLDINATYDNNQLVSEEHITSPQITYEEVYLQFAWNWYAYEFSSLGSPYIGTQYDQASVTYASISDMYETEYYGQTVTLSTLEYAYNLYNFGPYLTYLVPEGTISSLVEGEPVHVSLTILINPLQFSQNFNIEIYQIYDFGSGEEVLLHTIPSNSENAGWTDTIDITLTMEWNALDDFYIGLKPVRLEKDTSYEDKYITFMLPMANINLESKGWESYLRNGLVSGYFLYAFPTTGALYSCAYISSYYVDLYGNMHNIGLKKLKHDSNSDPVFSYDAENDALTVSIKLGVCNNTDTYFMFSDYSGNMLNESSGSLSLTFDSDNDYSQMVGLLLSFTVLTEYIPENQYYTCVGSTPNGNQTEVWFV